MKGQMTQPPEFTEAELEDQEMFRFMVDAYHAFRAKKQIRLMVEFHFLEVMLKLTDQLAAEAREVENFTLEINLVLSVVPEYTAPEKLWRVFEDSILDEFPVARNVPSIVPEPATIPYNADAATTRFVRKGTRVYLDRYFVPPAEEDRLPSDEFFPTQSTSTNPDTPPALQAKNRRRTCPVEGIPIHHFNTTSARPQEGAV